MKTKKIYLADIKLGLSELSDTSPEAVRKSYAGVPFNVFDDVWKVTANKSAYLDRVDNVGYPFEILVQVRKTLSDVASTKTASVACNVINLIGRRMLPSLTLTDVKKLVAKSRTNKSDVVIKNAKTFILCLERRFPQYQELGEYIRKVKIRDQNKKPSIFDPNSGALTSYEHKSLAESINRLSREVFRDYMVIRSAQSQKYLKQGLSLLPRFQRLIYLRLICLTARRSVQLFMLKWRDLIVGASRVVDEFQLRIPMAKQGGDGGFRSRFEEGLIPLDQEFSQELTLYKEYITKLFYCRLVDLGIETTFDEFMGVSTNLPILVGGEFFTELGRSQGKLPLNNQEFLLMAKYNSPSFHVQKTGFSAAKGVLDDVESDRQVDIAKTFGSTRARHTVGTNLARKGYDKLTIAMQLGNTPKAAGYYIDLLPEDRDKIDSEITGLKILAKKFSGTVVFEANHKNAEIHLNQKPLGESCNTNGCLSCSSERPLQCYGCENFRPLATADHEEMLVIAEKRMRYQINLGAEHAVLAPIKININNIKATIIACRDYVSVHALPDKNQA